MSKCNSCGAEIIWVKTIAGKSMPCDAGLITFERAGGPETFVMPDGKVERGKRSPEGNLKGYISHFATCPNAAHHRKTRSAKNG